MILTIFEGPYSICEPPLQGGAMHCVLIDQNARKAIFARMLASVFADMLRLIIGEPKVRVRLTLTAKEKTEVIRLRFLAGAEGLEPTTHGFGDQYSTN